jgi:hypothetical protein
MMTELPHNPQAFRAVHALGDMGVGDHVCLVRKTKAEQLSAAISFTQLGLDRQQKCLYIARENPVRTILEEMIKAGIDVRLAVTSGALRIITEKQAYLKSGDFEPDTMIDFLRQQTGLARKEGFAALRVIGEMTWVLADGQSFDRLLDYEAKLANFFFENPCVAACQYCRERFPDSMIVDMIRVHPLVMDGDHLWSSPYYVGRRSSLPAGPRR